MTHTALAQKCMKELRDNHYLPTPVRIQAGELLIRSFTKRSVNGDAITFLMNHSDSYVMLYMNSLKQRDLDGHHLWIDDNGACLTVRRGTISEPVFESIEGEWTEKQKHTALYLYQFTEAAKR